MKKAMVFAAAFAAGSALAQVGSLNGGSISDMGVGARYGAGPQIPATDARAPRTSATVGAPAISGSTSAGTDSTAAGAGPAPITSGTSWGSPQTAAPIDAAQTPREPRIDNADRPAEKR